MCSIHLSTPHKYPLPCPNANANAKPNTAPPPQKKSQKNAKQAVKTAGGAPSGVVQYWYFDINHWEKRLFPQTTPANLTAIASGMCV